MNLKIFNNMKKRVKTYKSNITVENLGLLEQLDRTVAVIVKNGSINIDGAIHICITQRSYDQEVEKLIKEDKNAEYAMEQTVLGMIIDNIIQQEYRALIIDGLLPTDCIVTKEDLMSLRDVIDSFCIMFAFARGKISNEKVYELMKDKIVYIIGTLPKMGMKKGDTFGFATIIRNSEKGSYESVKCFLTKESAEKFNTEKTQINAVNLNKLASFCINLYGVIIEPHRNYWVEFNADNAQITS